MSLKNILLKRNREEDINFYNDDVRILRSYIDYKDNGKTLDYMIYEIEMLDKTGELRHFYKALKFIRIIRLPKSAKQSTSFMDMHAQVLSGIWERQLNFITLICNMIEPVPLGLMYLYGVQGVAETIEEAKHITNNDFHALTAMLQGTYKTLEYKVLNYEEVGWLREKMYAMKFMSVVRGFPDAKDTASDGGNKGFGSSNVNPDSQDTTEEFIAGMSDKEYVIQILSTPVNSDTLNNWLTQTAQQLTKWNSQMQGQKAMNFGISLPMMYMASLGSSSGWNHSYSDAENIGFADTHTDGASFTESISNSTSTSHTNSFTSGQNVGANQGASSNEGTGHNIGVGESAGISHGDSESANMSNAHSEGTSYGVNEGESYGTSHSNGVSESSATSHSHSTSSGVSDGSSATSSHNVGSSHNHGVSSGHNFGTSNGNSTNWGSNSMASHSEGNSTGSNLGANFGLSGGMSGGSSSSDTASNGNSFSQGISHGSSEGFSSGVSNSSGSSEGFGNSVGHSHSVSQGVSDGMSTSHGRGTSEGWGTSSGVSRGQSFGASAADSTGYGRSVGTNDGWSRGVSSSEGVSTSQGQGQSAGVSQGYSAGQSEGVSSSQGTTQGHSKGTTSTDGSSNSWGNSHGVSQGFTGGFNQATSATMGVGPSLSFSKSFQWLDAEVQNVVELLQFQNDRLMMALNGNGAFFTDVYIATPNEETKASAQALAKSTWYNENALVCPLQVMDLTDEEQSHLLYHFNAFSADTTLEGVPGHILSYRYTTVLLPHEQAAYNHLPRISEGGVFADVLDIPKLAVPSMRKGEIYMGKILSGERWTQRWGYETPFDYRISSQEIMHGFFTGESRSGKTVAATRFVAELANKVKREDGKRMRIVCMDPKQDWRILAKFIEPERFKFFSLGNPEFAPINLNILKIPQNVYPQLWIDGIIEIFCRAYGLGERGKSVLSETFYKLYEQAGVFVPEWKSVAPERSRQVTLTKIYNTMRQIKLDLETPQRSGKGKVGNDVRDAYSRVLDRLQVFGRAFSIEAQLFGREDGIGIDDLIGKDDVVILESYGLESTFKNFVFGCITSGFFKYAQSHEGGFKSVDQYETILIIEEANEVLTGQDSGSQNSSPLGGQSEFEKILDQSAGLGLFIFSITQKIADMPSSVIANSGLVFAGKISRQDDVSAVIRKIGREEKFDDRDLVKWFPRSPIGWFVCRSSRNFDFKEVEPILVHIAPLDVEPPTNEELLHIIALKEARQQQTNSN